MRVVALSVSLSVPVVSGGWGRGDGDIASGVGFGGYEWIDRWDVGWMNMWKPVLASGFLHGQGLVPRFRDLWKAGVRRM